MLSINGIICEQAPIYWRSIWHIELWQALVWQLSKGGAWCKERPLIDVPHGHWWPLLQLSLCSNKFCCFLYSQSYLLYASSFNTQQYGNIQIVWSGHVWVNFRGAGLTTTETSWSVCNFSWEGAIASETTDVSLRHCLPVVLCHDNTAHKCFTSALQVLSLTFLESNKYYLQLEQVPLLALPVPLVRWRTMPTGKLQNCNSRHQEKASSWDGWFQREMAFF